MSAAILGGTGPQTPTPPGVGCAPVPFDTVSGAYSTTGNTTAGSPVITGIASTPSMGPMRGVCPVRGAVVGGYAIVGPGIPSNAVIKSVDGPTQITMTHPAT